MKQRILALVVLAGLFIAGAIPARAQNAAAAARRLLSAKTIYVEPMPNGLDQWIIQDLRAWGRYRILGSSEGVDLLMRAKKPGHNDMYKPQGVIPKVRHPKQKPPVLSLTIVNWVTGARVWQVDLLDRGPKKNQPAPPLGPRTEIDARHMKPDQIAERCVDRLRKYVESLQVESTANPQ